MSENSANANACTKEQKKTGCSTVVVNFENSANWKSDGILNYTPCGSDVIKYGSKAAPGNQFCAKKGTDIAMTYQGRSQLSQLGLKVKDKDLTFLCKGQHTEGRWIL